MRYLIIIWLVIFTVLPASGRADDDCRDARTNPSGVSKPCAQSPDEPGNVPLKAEKLSDTNTVETVKRFYQAMSAHDPVAASRLLADSFTSEVRQPHNATIKDNKTSMIKGLKMVLGATQLYNAKIDCQVKNRTPQAYSLSCLVDEQGIVMDQFHRTRSEQSVTIVLDNGVAKISKIVSLQHD